MQVDMRIYTVAEAKTPYFKRDYSLCDFVVQAQKSESFDFRIFHLCRKAQLRLRAAHATSFSCRLTSFRRKADTSEVARSANEDGYAKRSGLTPNGVALRANGGAVVRYCA